VAAVVGAAVTVACGTVTVGVGATVRPGPSLDALVGRLAFPRFLSTFKAGSRKPWSLTPVIFGRVTTSAASGRARTVAVAAAAGSLRCARPTANAPVKSATASAPMTDAALTRRIP
jgi:hypothetical protein